MRVARLKQSLSFHQGHRSSNPFVSAKEIAMNMHDINSQLKSLNDMLPADIKDRVLDAFGLQQRRPVRSAISGVTVFLAGIVVGGAAALLLSPKSGIEVRSDLEDKLDTLITKVKGLIPGMSAGDEDDDKSEDTSAKKASSSGQGTKKEPRTPSSTPGNSLS
jgi:gas vesicle protein